MVQAEMDLYIGLITKHVIEMEICKQTFTEGQKCMLEYTE